MSIAIPLMFTGVAAAMIANGAVAHRSPERREQSRLFFASGGLFLLAALIFFANRLFA